MSPARWTLLRTPRVLFVVGAVAGIGLALACDGSKSCPGPVCDPASDGDPFDLLAWCEQTGACARDGEPSPVCDGADAEPPPACALGPLAANETLSFPLGDLAPVLGGRRDLIVTYAACDFDAGPPDFDAARVLFDGKPADCESTNPCDPSATPIVTTCLGVPATVHSVTLSLRYRGTPERSGLQVEMKDTKCSYFCS